MPVKCEEYNNVCVIGPEVSWAGEVSAAIRKLAIENIDQRHIVDFVVDMEKCEFIDSEGLETLLWLKKRCEELFGRMKIASANENIQKILEITRLQHRFEVHSDLPGALKTIR